MDNKGETEKISSPEGALQKIKSGEISMRPRWYFLLHSAVVVTGGVFLCLTLLYLVSFIFYALRESGLWVVPGLGAPASWQLLFSLPWLLIVVAIVFIVLLEILVRQFAFSYRRPLLYTVGVIVLFVIVVGGFVSTTSFHRRVFNSVERRHVPLAPGFYRSYARPRLPNVVRGRVVGVSSRGLLIMTAEGEAVSVFITPHTRLPGGAEFETGDTVIIAGERRGDTIAAFGLQEIEP